jgi:hypothetical protein
MSPHGNIKKPADFELTGPDTGLSRIHCDTYQGDDNSLANMTDFLGKPLRASEGKETTN